MFVCKGHQNIYTRATQFIEQIFISKFFCEELCMLRVWKIFTFCEQNVLLFIFIIVVYVYTLKAKNILMGKLLLTRRNFSLFECTYSGKRLYEEGTRIFGMIFACGAYGACCFIKKSRDFCNIHHVNHRGFGILPKIVTFEDIGRLLIQVLRSM